MNIIAAVDNNWGIGKDGRLLVSIPEDMKLFISETLNKVVIMGRKTLESFPGGKPLKNRLNIVLTSDRTLKVPDAIVCNSVEEVLEKISAYNTGDVYVVGGESIYRQFMPYCNTALITKIDYHYDADKYLPDLDADEAWRMTETSEEQTYYDIEYYFTKYEKR